MEADAGASSSKRPAEIPPETLEEELEILSLGAEQDVEEHAEWVRMENGTDWMPPEAVEKGDLAELQGLLDDGCSELIQEAPQGARRMGGRFVRRIKGTSVKSRWVLQDFAKAGKITDGGGLFAATPSAATLRLLLALGSHRKACGEELIILIADVTRAFPHADIDVPVVTAIPWEANGVKLKSAQGETITLTGGQLVLILKALYGYRRSPRLWQLWLADALKRLSMFRSQADPALFVIPVIMLWLLAHVDDMFIMGKTSDVEELFRQL
jgi:hypothetical protein